MDFTKMIHMADDEAFADQIGGFLDMDQFLRFLAVNVVLSNLDSFLWGTQNHYMYLDPESNRFQFIPWDMDLAFGGLPLAGTPEERAQLSIDQPQLGDNPLIRRVLAVDDYRRKHRDYVRLYKDSLFEEKKVLRSIESTASFIRPFIALSGEDALSQFDDQMSDSPEPFVMGPGGPGSNNYRIRTFLTKRHASLRAQLAGDSDGKVLEMIRPPPGSMKQWGVVLILGLAAVIANLIAWVRGVIAGFHGSSLWGCLNLLLYPLTTVIYGYRIRHDLGHRQARMALWSITALTAVVLLAWGWIF